MANHRKKIYEVVADLIGACLATELDPDKIRDAYNRLNEIQTDVYKEFEKSCWEKTKRTKTEGQ